MNGSSSATDYFDTLRSPSAPNQTNINQVPETPREEFWSRSESRPRLLIELAGSESAFRCPDRRFRRLGHLPISLPYSGHSQCPLWVSSGDGASPFRAGLLGYARTGCAVSTLTGSIPDARRRTVSMALYAPGLCRRCLLARFLSGESRRRRSMLQAADGANGSSGRAYPINRQARGGRCRSSRIDVPSVRSGSRPARPRDG